MEKIKEKYRKYRIQEWIALIFGIILLSIQVFRYATNSLAENGLEIVVFAIAFMLIFAPRTILEIIRKIKGLTTK